ncbi:ZGRF1 protein, partial [Urocolius indicus]|nr:ZGRF1 protein [Urocolius indicus]
QVLYTHQKLKKSKTWQDGILRMRSGGNKAVLCDDKGQCLESIFVTSQVNVGDNLESERYLITVEAVKVHEKSFEDQPQKAVTSTVDRNSGKSAVLPPRHLSVGLKRKFTGFQGPRQVEKKVSTMEDGEKPIIFPLSKQCQGTFPSKVFVTSPLFTTICKKDVETNLSADFHEDASMDNDREHMSLSSLLSSPFLGRCEETENHNSDQFVVKPKSPLITGHTKSGNHAASHGVVSHNIRSTAQIMALLKSQPTQGCREPTTSEATEHVSRFQTSENVASLCNQKSTILPAFAVNPAKRHSENIHHLPLTRRTVNESKEWNAALLLNSAEQPCDQEVAGQRHAEKANSLSQDLQDPCNKNSCFLPESTKRRVDDSQRVPPSGDMLCSESLVTFKKDFSGYREHSVTNGLKENSSVKPPSELQPRQSLERVPHHPELSVDITLTETRIGEDVAPNASWRLGSGCEVVTHCRNEKVKCSMFNRGNSGNDCHGDTPPQLCGGTGRIAEDSANQSRIEVELLGDGHNTKEINEHQLSTEATNSKEDLAGCTVHTISGTSWIKSKPSDLLPSDTNVDRCQPKTSTLEKSRNVSCISTSRVSSAMDKSTQGDVTQLGFMKSPDVDLDHLWGTKGDDIKQGSLFLPLSQKADPTYGSFQYIAEGHQKVFGISHQEDTHSSRSSVCPLGKGHSAPEKAAVGEPQSENIDSINSSEEACKGERIGMDCLKHTATAENSSYLPHLVNDIALVRALTQHSTALESLQKMEENNSLLYE